MNEFKNLILQAKQGNEEAMEILLRYYKPLMLSMSYVDGTFDEDLYQEFQEIFVKIAKNKNFF